MLFMVRKKVVRSRFYYDYPINTIKGKLVKVARNFFQSHNNIEIFFFLFKKLNPKFDLISQYTSASAAIENYPYFGTKFLK